MSGSVPSSVVDSWWSLPFPVWLVGGRAGGRLSLAGGLIRSRPACRHRVVRGWRLRASVFLIPGWFLGSLAADPAVPDVSLRCSGQGLSAREGTGRTPWLPAVSLVASPPCVRCLMSSAARLRRAVVMSGARANFTPWIDPIQISMYFAESYLGRCSRIASTLSGQICDPAVAGVATHSCPLLGTEDACLYSTPPGKGDLIRRDVKGVTLPKGAISSNFDAKKRSLRTWRRRGASWSECAVTRSHGSE